MAHRPSPLDGILTPDRRYIVVRGRLWRATNPGLSTDDRARWQRDLMAARRAIARFQRDGDDEAVRRARQRVHRAKLALGERGEVWWQDNAPDHNRRMVANTPYRDWFARAEGWRAAIDELLEARAPGATICPSDVARADGASGWRQHLDEIRDVARALARRGALAITQRGRVLDPSQPFAGPIRFGRPTPA